MTTLHQRLTLFYVLLLLLRLTATGQDDSSLTFSREAAIESAVRNNPELSVAALEIERAKSRLRWAGRLENPELELSSSTDQFGLNEDEGSFEIAFSQRFPVTSRLRDEKTVRKHDVDLAEIEFQVRQRQLAYEVDKAALTLLATERKALLQSQLIELNKGIVTFMANRVELGEMSPLDVTQASLNGQLLDQELGTARAAITDARSRLQKLLGTDPDQTVSISDSLVLSPEAPSSSIDLNAVLQNRPDYASLLAFGDLGRAQLSLATAQRWDDISVKLFASRELAQDAPEGLERNTFAGIGLSIPLPLRNRNEQAIEEAKIDIEKARRARGAKMFEIHSELRAALKAREAAHQLALSASGEALELAKKNFNDFKAAQQTGQASLLQVQQAQTQLLQLENSALEFQKNYHITETEVRFIAGTYPIPQVPAYTNDNSNKK
ncbi:MAG: TolC family protein [Verrucomicrobiales bacterium]